MNSYPNELEEIILMLRCEPQPWMPRKQRGCAKQLQRVVRDETCRFCGNVCGFTRHGKSIPLHRCHVVPRVWGGNMSKSNIITLCQKCHLSFDRFVGVQMSDWPGGIKHP